MGSEMCIRDSARRLHRPPGTAYVPERFPTALPFTAHGHLTRLGALPALVVTGSPARQAITSLVTGSRSGTEPLLSWRSPPP